MLYYSLTTLSTVGFGDFSPTTTGERCFIILVFMITLLVFSSIISIIQTYFEDFIAAFEEPD